MTRSLALSFPREVLNRHTLNAGRAVAVFAALAMGATAAQAQLSQTFVAVSGVDNNTCARTAPCKTFNGALAKTKVNGEVICLDKGNFHTATIKMSVSIDCHDAVGSIFQTTDDGLVVISHGIVIDFASFAADDARKTVNLRGLNVQGLDWGSDGILITDFTAAAGSPLISLILGATGGSVFIEDCVINGEFGSVDGRGISDTRSHGGELYISDTTVRNMGGSAIDIGKSINVTIDNTRVQNAKYGLATGNGAKVTVNRSVFSGNTEAGIEADPGATVVVNDSASVHNKFGVQSGGSVLLSNSSISFNTTGVSGPVSSFGNNRFSNNTADGMVMAIPLK
jgi:Right handed beta helix region